MHTLETFYNCPISLKIESFISITYSFLVIRLYICDGKHYTTIVTESLTFQAGIGWQMTAAYEQRDHFVPRWIWPSVYKLPPVLFKSVNI